MISQNTLSKEKDQVNKNTNQNCQDYSANKLMLATFIGIVALFTPIFGLFHAIIAKNMANELPLSYSTVDVKRARKIAKVALEINVLEVIIGVIVAICVIIDTVY